MRTVDVARAMRARTVQPSWVDYLEVVSVNGGELEVKRALVVVESMFGNTRRIADAIADGMAPMLDVTVVNIGGAPDDLTGYDLLLVGGPTHVFGMSRPSTRHDAAGQARDIAVPTGAGIREWLDRLPHGHLPAAATFDTRINRPRLAGSAAKAAKRRLQRAGARIVAPATSFYVTDTQGPLAPDELERARGWGARLASDLAGATAAP